MTTASVVLRGTCSWEASEEEGLTVLVSPKNVVTRAPWGAPPPAQTRDMQWMSATHKATASQCLLLLQGTSGISVPQKGHPAEEVWT